MGTADPPRSWAKHLLLLPALLAAVGGCTDVVRVSSEPSGAQLRVGGRMRGVTPVAVMVNRCRQRIAVELRHPACQPLTGLLRREADGRPVPRQHFRLEPAGTETAPSEGMTPPATPAGGSGQGVPAVVGDGPQESRRP